MFKTGKFLITVAMMTMCAYSAVFAQISIVVNNVGYERTGVKRAIVQSTSAITATEAQLINASGAVVHTIALGPQMAPAQWRSTSTSTGVANSPGFGNFKVADFSDFTVDGDDYRVRVGTVTSPTFSIGEKLLQTKTGADQVRFFYRMRNVDEEDMALPIFGSSRRHNIYGGWWDATGDPGKHLSHLSYSNYYNPQQIPMVVWALLHAHEMQPNMYSDSARAEAAWGADYLLRSIAPDGYFYESVFDNWGDKYTWTPASASPGTSGGREICAWGTIAPSGLDFNSADGTHNARGIRTGHYRSGLRQGAGVSIASLARASKAGIRGDSAAAQYLAGAERTYAHLKGNLTTYLDNGRMNIIDFYSGLLAATELYNATDNPDYLSEARAWKDSILAMQSENGWFYSGRNAQGQRYRPFHHAAEEGFPVVALARFWQVAATASEKLALREAVRKNLLWYTHITRNTGDNPFDYAKIWREVSLSLAEAAGGDGGGSGTANGNELAQGKPATASNEEVVESLPLPNCPGGRCLADFAFDGNPNTRWSSFRSGAENDSQWIRVDLGAIYKIDRVILNWEAAFGRHYLIQVSTDGNEWITTFEVTNNNAPDRATHTFTSIDARYVRMFGITRGTLYGFSLINFEVYGTAADGDIDPSANYQAFFFIPKVNETGYWWQGENARLASMASAFILGAALADDVGTLWSDTLYPMATAQLDWVLGKNPFNVCMMYGHGYGSAPEYPHFEATRHIPNVKGGICNGISSMRSNENNIEWIPYRGANDGDAFWRNWRFIEQWLPHNAWYLMAISSLSYRIDNPFEPEDIVSVRTTGSVAASPRLKITAARGGNVRVELPFAADLHTEVIIYNMLGRKIFSQSMEPGCRYIMVKIPARIATGAYVLSIRDMAGKNIASGRVHLR